MCVQTGTCVSWPLSAKGTVWNKCVLNMTPCRLLESDRLSQFRLFSNANRVSVLSHCWQCSGRPTLLSSTIQISSCNHWYHIAASSGLGSACYVCLCFSAIGSTISTPWCWLSSPLSSCSFPSLHALCSFLLQSLLVTYSWAQLLLMLPGDQQCGEVHWASLPDPVNKEELENVGGCWQHSFGL